jgi:uncharacterized RmlC-like cupin family protein
MPTAVAPDGVAIHTFDVPGASLVGVAQGQIPMGRFAVHRHLTLEQYTYVVSGRLRAITATHERPASSEIEMTAGDLLLTLPWESLQFINESNEVASVLFICAPPYPADDSDTRVLDNHQPLDRDEVADATERLRSMRASINAEIDGRLALLAGLAERHSDRKA